jgi:hypothetical protein
LLFDRNPASFSNQIYTVSASNESIAKGVGDTTSAEVIMPFFDWKLRGNYARTSSNDAEVATEPTRLMG